MYVQRLTGYSNRKRMLYNTQEWILKILSQIQKNNNVSNFRVTIVNINININTRTVLSITSLKLPTSYCQPFHNFKLKVWIRSVTVEGRK